MTAKLQISEYLRKGRVEPIGIQHLQLSKNTTYLFVITIF